MPLQQALRVAKLAALIEIPDREGNNIRDKSGKIIAGPDIRSQRSGKSELQDDCGQQNNREKPAANFGHCIEDSHKYDAEQDIL